MLALIASTVAQGARLERACEVLGLAARTVQRWQRAPLAGDARVGPKSKPSHALNGEERRRIVELVNRPAYRNLSPEQAIAKLADDGVYVCSERSLRRILVEEKLATYRQRSKPASSVAKPREYVAREPLRVLSWDITYLRSSTVRGEFFYLYLFLDIWSRRIVAAQVHDRQDAALAAELLHDLCNEQGLRSEKLVVHSDNGAPMKGSTMLATMQALGITASFSRPSVSDDNAFAEALFRHLKYAPSYPRRGFADLGEARQWLAKFVSWYNTQHLHSSIGFVTPLDRHDGRDIEVLAKRRALYEAAVARNPRRWTRTHRKWHRPEIVTLNPDRVVLTASATHTTAA